MRLCRTSLITFALGLLCSCSVTRRTNAVRREIPPRSPEKIIDAMLVHGMAMAPFFSAKCEVDLKDENGSKSFKAHIRMVGDSAAWISVIPGLGIEVARAVLSKDSLKVIDKLNDTYFLSTLEGARSKFGLQPDLSLFQQAMMGGPVGFDPGEKYRSDRDNGSYLLTSKEKRRFIRAAEDLAPEDSLNDRDLEARRMERILARAEEREAVVYRYWLDPDSFLVQRVLITDLAREQQADLRYDERVNVDGRSLPSRISMDLSDQTRKVSIKFALSRIALDGPLNLGFRVPEKFTPMP